MHPKISKKYIKKNLIYICALSTWNVFAKKKKTQRDILNLISFIFFFPLWLNQIAFKIFFFIWRDFFENRTYLNGEIFFYKRSVCHPQLFHLSYVFVSVTNGIWNIFHTNNFLTKNVSRCRPPYLKNPYMWEGVQ